MKVTETKPKEIKIPEFVLKAITSKTAAREPYNRLSPEEWKDLARHIQNDLEVSAESGINFLPARPLREYGTKTAEVLDSLLYLAVDGHDGFTDLVPHHDKVLEAYRGMYGKVYDLVKSFVPKKHL